jgi:hypothetical protein
VFNLPQLGGALQQLCNDLADLDLVDGSGIESDETM